MTNKYYNLTFYKSYLEIKINSLPKDNFNKNKLFYDLVLYYELNDTIIRYKNFILCNKKELKLFLNHIKMTWIYTKFMLRLYKIIFYFKKII